MHMNNVYCVDVLSIYIAEGLRGLTIVDRSLDLTLQFVKIQTIYL